MRQTGRRLPIPSQARVAVACCLALAAAPGAASAQLSGNLTHGYSAVSYGGPDNADAVVSSMPGPDQLGVGLEGTSLGFLEFDDLLWSDDFSYTALVAGAGLVEWGHASGNLSLDVQAKPDELQAVPPGTGTLANGGFARADGMLILQFVDTGTVTSPTLAAGTPVTIEVFYRVDSVAAQPTPHPDPNILNNIGAQFQAMVTDLTSGGNVHRLVNDVQLTSASLATAVGRTLEIDAQFNVYGQARAGYSGGGFLTQSVGEIAAVGGVWLGVPGDVAFVASSAHDYTVPVPEPRASWLGGAVVLALAAMRLAAHAPHARVERLTRPAAAV